MCRQLRIDIVHTGKNKFHQNEDQKQIIGEE